MKTLVVGAGALGGIIGARLLAVGASVSLATRNATSAEEIKASGLRVTGIGGDLSIETGEVAPLADYSVSGSFDLIVLATNAQDAIDVAPSLVESRTVTCARGHSASGPERRSSTDPCKAARGRMHARRSLKPHRHNAEVWDIRAKQCRLPFDRRAWRGRKRSKRTGAPVA
jgi:D-arabinose 1-dehydrogenase-like Zn-dependent alcohol dehydrogenase